MGNRRKTRLERRVGKKRKEEITMHFSEQGAEKMGIPIQEQEVVKEVPAVIHWDNLPDYGRDDVETIGKCLIYEDGSQDVVIFDAISKEAKDVIYGLNSQLDRVRLAKD